MDGLLMENPIKIHDIYSINPVSISIKAGQYPITHRLKHTFSL